MSVSTFQEALVQAHARMLELADKHRCEQDKLFRELITNFGAEVTKSNAEARLHRKNDEELGIATTSGIVGRQIPCADTGHAAGTGANMPVHILHHSEISEARAFHGQITIEEESSSKAVIWLERVLWSTNFGDQDTYMTRMSLLLLRYIDWFQGLKEPHRDGLLARFVDGKMFNLLCFVVITLNAVFIVVTTDYEIAYRNSELPQYMMYCEIAFMGFYIVELCLKLVVHRGFFLVGPDAQWNWLDLFLVLMSFSDVIIFSEGSAIGNISFMRALRLFKLAKVLRVFRTVRYLSEMRLIFDCVIGSFVSLVWCCLMIAFVVYVFALLIVQGLAQDLRNPEIQFDETIEAAILDEFGSVQMAMMSLIECTTGGHDWSKSHKLLKNSKSFVPYAFLAYMSFFVLAAWNIVTSIFVEKALKLAQPDLETRALEQHMQDVVDAQELTKIFSEVDTDSSGTISIRELESVMTHPRFRSYLRVRGIDIRDAHFFHRMMASVVGDDSEDIDLRFVVAACLRMKGVASSMDLHALTFESKLLNRKHRAHVQDCSQRLGRIEQCLREIVGDRLMAA
eukprot:CAMPEP_0176011736 /NCGR_PEP_ID=MMETSP0120_2-20121206/5435_1 /TAXON_ID=160619 /ORGANISM="Kryptoperidinium foliaceum, Strain CCMP 1326" /LENGTH=566 /DNA_ID=CAMNT_0017344603 /DNA_START=51 /DNA_END=1751 /DNA_ORIENTATION=-